MAVEVCRVRGIVGVALLPEAGQQGVVAEDGEDDERDDHEVGEVHHRVLGLPRLRGDDEARGLPGEVALLALEGDLRGAAVGRVPPIGTPHTCVERQHLRAGTAVGGAPQLGGRESA